MTPKTIGEWAEERSLIPESQFGFRKYRSTLDCIFIRNTAIEVSMSQKKQLYVCYVDFKKAFDSINHKLLWSCLKGILELVNRCLLFYNPCTPLHPHVSRYPVTKPLPLSHVKKESDRGVY